jgi:RHS repeat-associated protein
MGSTPVALLTPDPKKASNPPQIFFVHADHLDTPRIVEDRAGNLRWRWWAEPFGTTAAETNPGRLGALNLNLRFPGQYFDRETGLHYNWHRDYDASVGRYVSSDPMGLEGGINTYSYVGSVPTMAVDSKGLQAAQAAQLLIRYGAPLLAGVALEASRPRNMTRLEERQFDRDCVNAEDPCRALKDEANKAIDEAMRKMDNMYADRSGMFGNAGWDTHGKDLMGRIDQINAIISLGQKMGCDMSAEIVRSMVLRVPNSPRAK